MVTGRTLAFKQTYSLSHMVENGPFFLSKQKKEGSFTFPALVLLRAFAWPRVHILCTYYNNKRPTPKKNKTNKMGYLWISDYVSFSFCVIPSWG